MTERESADIIPFPAPARPASVRTLADAADADPGARLRIALAALDAALDAQRNAVADWRTALNELRGSMGTLGRSLHGYQDSLGTLDSRVEALGATARQLEAQADVARNAAAD